MLAVGKPVSINGEMFQEAGIIRNMSLLGEKLRVGSSSMGHGRRVKRIGKRSICTVSWVACGGDSRAGPRSTVVLTS